MVLTEAQQAIINEIMDTPLDILTLALELNPDLRQRLRRVFNLLEPTNTCKYCDKGIAICEHGLWVHVDDPQHEFAQWCKTWGMTPDHFSPQASPKE